MSRNADKLKSSSWLPGPWLPRPLTELIKIVQFADDAVAPWIKYSKEVANTIWEQVPPFYKCTLFLLYQDFLRLLIGYSILLIANSQYRSYENKLPTSCSYFIYGMLLTMQSVLMAMAWLQKPQSMLHSSVLLLKMPDHWQKEARLDVPKLNTSVCIDCNKLREIKGDFRSAILYFFQQMILTGIRLLPYGSWVSLPFHVLITGRAIAEYRYRTEGVCDRHIETTYREHREFFAVLGLCHFGGMSLSTFVLESKLGIPGYAFDTCFSGLLMLALVRLTYGMKNFPSPVKKSQRYLPSLGTHWLVDNSIDFAIFKLKRRLKDPDEALSLLVSCRDRAMFMQSVLTQFQQYCKNQSKKHTGFERLPLQFLLPTMLRSKNNFYNDPIFGEWFSNQIERWKGAIKSLLRYRQLMSFFVNKTERINELRRDALVDFALKWLVGGTIGFIHRAFTIDFLIHDAPAYVHDTRALFSKLASWTELPRWMKKVEEKLAALETNMKAVQRILNELPDSSRDEFFKLLVDERFKAYLQSVFRALEALQIGHVDECKDSENEDDGFEWVERPSSSAPVRVPTPVFFRIGANTVMCTDTLMQNGGRSPRRILEQVASDDCVVISKKTESPKVFGDSSDGEWDDSDRNFTRTVLKTEHAENLKKKEGSDDEWDNSDVAFKEDRLNTESQHVSAGV